LRALFEALDQRCNGQLAAWLGALTQHPEVTDPHPWPGGLDITDPSAAQVAAALPPVVLPQLWRALAQELSRWLAQGNWNSRLRIGQIGSSPEMALYLTSARRFGARETGMLPPQARHGRDGRRGVAGATLGDADPDASRRGAIRRRTRATSRCAPASVTAKRA
jgi:hypothetical protein